MGLFRKHGKDNAEGAEDRRIEVDFGAADAAPNAEKALSKRGAHAIAKPLRQHTVGSLEEALLRDFPAEDAESWDRTGVAVGERALPVKKVAVALDPTVSAIRKAAEAGAQVVVTHHPAYLSSPDSFAPENSVALSPGAGVWAAVQSRVALMSFHTALDVSPRAARVLPSMLGLDFTGSLLEPLMQSKRKGYGQICRVAGENGKPETLGRLAARCMAVFGRSPRVWGDFDMPLKRVATATGSAGLVGRAALEQGIDCLICGEIKYHEALDLSEAGLCVIELGHDVSELPLVAVLADAISRAGVARDDIVVLDQSGNWANPEAIRL